MALICSAGATAKVLISSEKNFHPSRFSDLFGCAHTRHRLTNAHQALMCLMSFHHWHTNSIFTRPDSLGTKCNYCTGEEVSQISSGTSFSSISREILTQLSNTPSIPWGSWARCELHPPESPESVQYFTFLSIWAWNCWGQGKHSKICHNMILPFETRIT